MFVCVCGCTNQLRCGAEARATPTGDAVAHVAPPPHRHVVVPFVIFVVAVVVVVVAVTPRGLCSNFGGVSISIHCHLPLGGGFRYINCCS